MERIKISPYARKTARELDVETSRVAGTGPEGRIVWRDIRAAAQSRKAPASAGAAAGLFTHVNLDALLAGLGTLPLDSLTLEGFVKKAVGRSVLPVTVQAMGAGIDGFLPCLRAGETAALGFGAADRDSKLLLCLAYDPSIVTDEAAADFLRRLAATLEEPYLLLA